MATQCFNPFQSPGALIFALDDCGNPVPGTSAYASTGQYVDITIEPSVTTGATVQVQKADGSFCVNTKLDDNLDWYDLTVNFCGFDPGLFAVVGGGRPLGATGNIVGAAFGTGLQDARWGLVFWLASSDTDCAGDQVQYLVGIIPFLKGGYVAPTVINGTDAVQFEVTGAIGVSGGGLLNYLQGANTLVPNLVPTGVTFETSDAIAWFVTTTPPPTAFCGTNPLPQPQLTSITLGTETEPASSGGNVNFTVNIVPNVAGVPLNVSISPTNAGFTIAPNPLITLADSDNEVNVAWTSAVPPGTYTVTVSETGGASGTGTLVLTS